MATINSVNNTLTSATGTGSFVGSASPVLTGAVDLSGATTFTIPNGSAPTLNGSGQIALDTNVTDFQAMLTYRDPSSNYYAIGMYESDLVNTNGYIVTYNSTSDKFVMTAPSGTGGKIVNYSIGTSTSDDTTTSTSLANTSLSASITPTSSSNILLIRVFGAGNTTYTSGSGNTARWGSFSIRRTSGSAADLIVSRVGRIARFDTSTEAATSYYPFVLGAQETAGSTSSHTYVCQFATGNAACTTTFIGASCPARMIIYELQV